MSYKTEWFEQKSILRIAKHFDVSADSLFDQGRTDITGAYGSNVENKLNHHPLFSRKEIQEFLEQEADRCASHRTAFQGTVRGTNRFWECTCGWRGKGTGNNGALIEGDRCPDCNTYL